MFIPGLVAILLFVLSPGSAEADLNSYPRIAPATAGDRVLIVAPHVDDEAIGAAGYAADAIASGASVYVAFLTAGDCNRISATLMSKTLGPGPSSFLAVGRTRIAEAHSAMQLLGIPRNHYFILGYPDRGLRTIYDHRSAIVTSTGTNKQAVPYEDAMSPGAEYRFDRVVADIEQVIDIARPTIVIAPVAFDRHPDHSAAAALTDFTLSAMQVNPRRLGYLVHSSRVPISLVHLPDRALTPPARMRSLDWGTYPLSVPVQKMKDVLLRSYKSQGPYAAILRNAFVRTNELFYVYPDEVGAVVPPSASVAPTRLPIAR